MYRNEVICGKCRWHRTQGGEWTCTNPEGEYYGMETEYRDSCEDGEER